MKRLILALLLLLPSWTYADALYQATGALAGVASGASATVTATLPTHLANDVFLLEVHTRNNNTVSTPPSGWTLLATCDLSADTAIDSFYYWFRASGAAETNPATVLSSATGDKYAVVRSFRGAETTGDPFDVESTCVLVDGLSLLTGITTLAANDLVIVAGMDSDNVITDLAYTATNPATITARDFQGSSTGDNLAVDLGAATRTTAGATGDITITPAGTPNNGSAIAFALTSAVAGGGSVPAISTHHFRRRR